LYFLYVKRDYITFCVLERIMIEVENDSLATDTRRIN